MIRSHAVAHQTKGGRQTFEHIDTRGRHLLHQGLGGIKATGARADNGKTPRQACQRAGGMLTGLDAFTDDRVGFCPLGIARNEGLLVCRHHALRKNSAFRAGRHAGIAVDTHIRIDKQHLGCFTECLYWTDINATGVFVANTALGDYVGHDLLRTRTA